VPPNLNNDNNKKNTENHVSHGCLDYTRSWAWQQILLNRRLAARQTSTTGEEDEDDEDCVLLLEHTPVYTLGRGASEAHLTFLNDEDDQESRRKLSRTARGPGTARLAIDRFTQMDHNLLFGSSTSTTTSSSDQVLIEAINQLVRQQDEICPVLAPNGVPIYRVERGGEVTFHGPQQLVVYPLIDLQRRPYEKDLHWFLRTVEEVIIQTLAQYGISGIRDEANTGVWVGNEKVAAVGISSSRWITTHGFAINVDPDLTYFDTSMILPCGIEGKGVTSMGKLLLQKNQSPPSDIPTVQEVAKVVLDVMEDIWGIRLESSRLQVR